MPLTQGMVQVYTGDGKGKTTAALGLSLRAVGHGLRVCVVQFMKGGGPYGEHAAAGLLAPHLTIHPTGSAGWVKRGELRPEDVSEAEKALALAEAALLGNGYDLVVLDEINGAVDYGLVPVEAVLALIARKPARVELVLTGRDAHERVVAAADLVSEVREVKHYFRQGLGSRVGIER